MTTPLRRVSDYGPPAFLHPPPHIVNDSSLTRLDNSSLQKQLLFSTTKIYARDPWIKAKKDLNISKT